MGQAARASVCEYCAEPMTFVWNTRRFCSDLCRNRANRAQHRAKRQAEKTCPQCQRSFETSSRTRIYCSRRCQRRARKAWHYYRQCGGEVISLELLGQRDRWRCGLCGKRVDAERHGHDQAAPTIDHIVPISLGGVHEYANVQLAHRSCNQRKGNRPAGEQLRLVG